MTENNYFLCSYPNIFNNTKLRTPQVEAYQAVYNHFITNKEKCHAIAVLPTGVGKTGLMGLLPYGVCNGRVLIITPQIIIRETVVEELDPLEPDNFWIKRGVFNHVNLLPVVVEIVDNNYNKSVLDSADIVILNIHKLQSRFVSPLSALPSDYFDMIIIDEAHHSVANTWVETLQHFPSAKVVKITGTPIRTDNRKIAGVLVYKYKLSQAMANNYVKSLKNISYSPDDVWFTIDNDLSRKYNIDEIQSLDIKDSDWIKRSVAMSDECSKSIVQESIKRLEEKLDGSDIPHKIIAVACNIEHAEIIKRFYEESGIASTILHSKMSDEDKASAKLLISTHKVKVVVNVAMLGEGYDHRYLSVAAIFRPFQSVLPYAQFIGRVLRYIPEGKTPKDNIADIVSHKYMLLDDLWNEYKIEVQESEIIKYLTEQNDILSQYSGNSDDPSQNRFVDIGQAYQSTSGHVDEDEYLNTELLRENAKREEEFLAKVESIKNTLGITEQEAKSIVKSANQVDQRMHRPDLFYKATRRDIDKRIKEEIVPKLIVKHELDKAGVDLSECKLFTQRGYGWIPNKGKNNAGMLSMYFNYYLKQQFGERKDWDIDDFETANAKLDALEEYVDNILEES